MNVRIYIPVLLLTLWACSSSLPAFGQLLVNPQIGLSASTLSTDPDNLESAARFGYQIGVSLRIGGRLHVQPGVYWQQSSTELREEVPTPQELRDDVNLDAILGTVVLGYNLIETQPVVLRVNGGLNGTSIVNVQDSEFDDLVDFNTVLLGAPIGVGADLLGFLTVDMSYEFGLTSLFDQVFGIDVDDITNNVFRFNVGVIF